MEFFFQVQLSRPGSGSGGQLPAAAFFGTNLKRATPSLAQRSSSASSFRVLAADIDESKQTDEDRWAHLATDISDDQQDITRGKGLVDSLFQAPMGDGTHIPVMTSYEYISQGLRT